MYFCLMCVGFFLLLVFVFINLMNGHVVTKDALIY